MKNKIMFIMFCLIIISFVNAATDTQIADNTAQVNTLIKYKKPCFNNGSYCSSSAVCNFTVTDPYQKIILNNTVASNKINYHNVSFYVDQIGIYNIDMVCCDGTYCGSETFYLDVTGSGYNNTGMFYLILLLIGGGFIFLGFWIKDAPITIFGSLVLYFIGIYSLMYGIDFIRNLTITRSVSFIILGVAAYISINAASEWIDI